MFHPLIMSLPFFFVPIVTSEYFCNLDGRSMRLDHLQRPELNQGTFDFSVPKEYWAVNPPETLTTPFYSVEPRHSGPRPPMPMNYVFLFDVSHEAVRSGFLQVACACVRTILFGGTSQDGSSVDPCFPAESSLAILTFDQTIHFYDLLVRLNPASRRLEDLQLLSQIKAQCWSFRILKKLSCRYETGFL
jgi:protein transport protein SEC24